MKLDALSHLTGTALVERLIEWRHKNKLTQTQTAERLKISVNTVRAYECGNRTPNGENTAKILVLIGALQSI
jgi:transcriptional regulator with XRE-family HTH domain